MTSPALNKASSRTRTLNPARAEEVREKIKATLIVKKLEEHILENSEMTSSQVSAALGLLKKSIPDLTAITMEVQGKLTHEVLLDELR